ncbi:acetylornithine deacetylase [Rhodobaculum claviforme]|uniref:Acetylornithine deacetylase n=1 Tax=Rhodobaculum claviforme TaxID=1549854 RepID=A0A934TKZ0_9RHOB|nr:acetylornithine deacetylase [Rhodobaculum claviforme]MBK5927459.1 acetylornithine deacetylase [Rhodobaculum claviforme]
MAERHLSARDILDRLVSFPTVSRDSNLELIDWVEEYLEGLGLRGHRVWDRSRTKAHLFVQVGPDVPGGVMLSAHTDVVPVDGQAWTSDPWTVTQRGGRLFGRGTCDMKGFAALALAALPRAQAADLKRPLQLALSYDEEIGCLAVVDLIAEMSARLPRAGAVVVGEPSMLRVVTGHKGGTGYDVEVRGHEVHSSLLHKGVSAVMEAARLIDWANRQNAASVARVAEHGPGPVAEAFDPPWTSVHVGHVRGGTAGNITAGHCRFCIEFRVIPGERVEDWEAAFEAEVARVEAAMQAVHPDTRIVLHKYYTLPPLQPEAGGAAEALVRRVTGDNATHAVSYGTEGGQFQAGGYSTVICGPGDIAQAHQPDEYLSVAQFEAGARFIDRIIDQLTE